MLFFFLLMLFLLCGCWWHRCVYFMRCIKLYCYSALFDILNFNTGFILKSQLNFSSNSIISMIGFHFIGKNRWRMFCTTSSAATVFPSLPPTPRCQLLHKGHFLNFFSNLFCVYLEVWYKKNYAVPRCFTLSPQYT